MKKIIIAISLLCSSSAFSANIIGFMSKEEGEKEYRVVAGQAVSAFQYDESDKELKVFMFNGGFYSFEVKTSVEVDLIISKVLNSEDKSLIELKAN